VSFDVSPTTLKFQEGATSQDVTIANTSTRAQLTFSLSADQPWVALEATSFVLDAGTSRKVNVNVSYAKAAFSKAAITVVAKDGTDTVDTMDIVVTTGDAEYWTQKFANDFNLEGKMIIFSPDGTPSFYHTEKADLPAGADVNMRLASSSLPSLDQYQPLPSLLYSDPIPIKPLDGKLVWLYGKAYDTVFIGSDGRVTFDDPVVTEAKAANDPVAKYFATAGVSALFTQLGVGGKIYAVQLDDRLLIVYDEVPQLNVEGSSNSFQIELFFDDMKGSNAQEVALAWFNVDNNISAIVGLSEGGGTGGIDNDANGDGIPDDFVSSGSEATNLLSQATTTSNTRPLKVSLDF